MEIKMFGMQPFNDMRFFLNGLTFMVYNYCNLKHIEKFNKKKKEYYCHYRTQYLRANI